MKTYSSGFSLNDVFLIAGIRSRTGELTLESGNNIGTMLLHNSNILQAFSPYSRSIGDLLVEDGLITEEELLETLKLQKQNNDPSSPLGGLLLKTGKVTFDVVEMMVREQIRMSVKEFLSWKDLNFAFMDKDIRPFDGIHVPISEIIDPETLRLAGVFIAKATPQQANSFSQATPIT